MSAFRNIAKLLFVQPPSNNGVMGPIYTLLPADGDGVGDQNQSFRVFFHGSQQGGAESPTTDIRLETSDDRMNWVLVASATQLAQDGQVHEFKDVPALGPYVRATTFLSGGTRPNHTASVSLVSNGAFRLVNG